MKTYTHTQVGYVMLAITFLTALLLGWIYLTTPSLAGDMFFIAVGFFLLFMLAAFSTLQTIVDSTRIQIKFGPGIFRKSFQLEDVASATVVQNPWYYGWGIRVWFWPYMWIYNVSGLDAVELVMKNGKVYRIGTDVPQELLRAIDGAR